MYEIKKMFKPSLTLPFWCIWTKSNISTHFFGIWTKSVSETGHDHSHNYLSTQSDTDTFRCIGFQGRNRVSSAESDVHFRRIAAVGVPKTLTSEPFPLQHIRSDIVLLLEKQISQPNYQHSIVVFPSFGWNFSRGIQVYPSFGAD